MKPDELPLPPLDAPIVRGCDGTPWRKAEGRGFCPNVGQVRLENGHSLNHRRVMCVDCADELDEHRRQQGLELGLYTVVGEP